MKRFAVPPLPKRWRSWIIGLAVASVVYSLIGFFLIPAIVKSQLIKRLPELTKRQAAVRQVRMNPWTLSLTIRGLALTEPDNRPFASWEEFYANFQLSSLFRWAWTFKEITLRDPFAAIILQEDGRLNFANMLQEKAPPAEPKESKGGIPRARIFLLNITNGVFVFEDHTKRSPFRSEYRPVNLRLTGITTRPGVAAPYSFKAEDDTGKRLIWTGDITVNPPGSRGAIGIRRAEPQKYQPYLDDFTRAQLVEGYVNVRADYFFSMPTNGVQLVVSNGIVHWAKPRVIDPSANETLFSASMLAVEHWGFNLQERTAHARLVKATAPELAARLNPDGSLNLLQMILPRTNAVSSSPDPNPAPPGQPWTITADEIRIENAGLDFEDQSLKTPFRTRFKPVELRVTQLTTRTNTDAAYTFTITTEASETVSGNGVFSINPVRSEGEAKVAAIDLKKYQPYAEQFLRGEIVSGKLDAAAQYRAALGGTRLETVVSNATVRLSDLQVNSADPSETIVSIPGFTVEDVEASLAEQTARVGSVKTSGGSILARRHRDGSINLLGLIQPPPPGDAKDANSDISSAPATPPPSEPNDGKPPTWTAFLEEISVEEYTVRVEDQVPPKPAMLNLDQIAIKVAGLSTVSNTPVEASLRMRLNESGSLEVRGTGTLTPQTADLEIGMTGIGLPAFQPYVEPLLNLNLAGGEFGMQGRVLWQASAQDQPLLQFTGGLSVDNLHTTGPAPSEELVKWTKLDVQGAEFVLQPNQLQIEAVRWDGLHTTILIGPDKRMNLASIVSSRTNAPPAASSAAPSPPPAAASADRADPPAPAPAGTKQAGAPLPFPVQLGTLEFANAAFSFRDASLEPNCRFEIQQFGGTITGISSAPNTVADVALAGRVDEQSPFSITGKVSPFAQDLLLNLSISNSNLQLSPFTPYMEKFAGHPLLKGRLALNLHYDLQGSKIAAQNHVEIEQLTLGPRNNSPDATSLPVKLAVALLKDRNGRIELDVPVEGSLDDPEFRVGRVILKTVINLITKVATSPFRLLGALVGAGEELSFVEFEPGEALLRESEADKVRKLAKALLERPAVNLEIEASADPQLDREALARRIVRNSIKQMRLEELAFIGQTPADPQNFEMDPAEYARLLRATVAKEFGSNLNEALRSLAAKKQAAENKSSARQTPQSGRKLGFFQRMTAWVPFRSKNSPVRVAREQAKADRRLLTQYPELAALTPDDLEALLAAKTEVPQDHFAQLLKARAEAVQREVLQTRELTADRLFLVAPKPIDASSNGQTRVNLSLN